MTPAQLEAVREVDLRLRAADRLASYGLDGWLPVADVLLGTQRLVRRAALFLRAVK